MDTETQYIPEVDDYVVWTTDLGMKHEGWVYCCLLYTSDAADE